MKLNAFSKKLRLLRNEEFKAVIAKRRRFGDNLLVLYAASNGCEYSRLGVSMGRAVGNAVVRNRLKRLVREAFRQNRDKIPPGFDYVAIGTPRAAKKIVFEEVEKSFLRLTGKAGEAKN